MMAAQDHVCRLVGADRGPLSSCTIHGHSDAVPSNSLIRLADSGHTRSPLNASVWHAVQVHEGSRGLSMDGRSARDHLINIAFNGVRRRSQSHNSRIRESVVDSRSSQWIRVSRDA